MCRTPALTERYPLPNLGLSHKIEVAYCKHFAQGDRRATLQKLRVPHERFQPIRCTFGSMLPCDWDFNIIPGN